MVVGPVAANTYVRSERNMSQMSNGSRMEIRASKNGKFWPILVVPIFAAAFVVVSPAQAAKYHLLFKWPFGIHEVLQDIEPNDVPLCNRVLANLNRSSTTRPYSWLSPPAWKSPITAATWSPANDAEREAVLRAQVQTECDIGICFNGRDWWDAKGKDDLQQTIQDKRLQIETATVALITGQQTKTIIRIHRTMPENNSHLNDLGFFNSQFYEVLQAMPLKLAALDEFRIYADAIDVDGKTYFYGYTTRGDDNYFKPLPETQSEIVLGQPIVGSNKSDGIVTICKMAFY